MNDLERTNMINMLLDFYSPLLTEKQLEYMELYFYDDLSLSEIAEQYNVSRNAVHDNISRTTKILENYEEKLQLYSKFKKRKELYDEIKLKYQDEKLTKLIEDLENID